MYFPVVKVFLSSVFNHLTEEKGLVALLLFSASCHVAISALRLGVVGCPAVCDCGNSLSYSLIIYNTYNTSFHLFYPLF